MDVAKVNVENLNLRKIQGKLLQWESKLAPLTQNQVDLMYTINQIGTGEKVNVGKSSESKRNKFYLNYFFCL